MLSVVHNNSRPNQGWGHPASRAAGNAPEDLCDCGL